MYEDARELVLKNQTKQQYIEELEVKKQTMQGTIKDLTQQLHLLRSQENRVQRDPIPADDSPVLCSPYDLVDRDLVQKLLLKIANLDNENRELREMYTNAVRDRDSLKQVAQQCIHQQEKIRQVHYK